MDADAIKMLATLLSNGGPVVTMFAIWIAWRASATATKAVQALMEIRDSVKATAPVVQEIAPLVKEIAKSTEDIDERTRDLHAALKVKAA